MSRVLLLLCLFLKLAFLWFDCLQIFGVGFSSMSQLRYLLLLQSFLDDLLQRLLHLFLGLLDPLILTDQRNPEQFPIPHRLVTGLEQHHFVLEHPLQSFGVKRDLGPRDIQLQFLALVTFKFMDVL